MNPTQILLYTTVSASVVAATAAYLASHLPLIWQISGGIAVFALVGYLAKDYQALLTLFSRRSARYGFNSLIMSLVVLAIVIVINLIANEYDVKKDFTKNQVHTLSDESVKVLKGLKSEVTMRAFVYPTQTQEYDQIFDKYTYHSKLLKKEYVDLDKEPLAVQKYNIKQQGTIIFENELRSSRVENLMGADDPKAEEKITNALIQVAKGEKKKIYFTSGHGERLMSDSGREGYSETKEVLENGRYKVEELTLLDKDRVPSDADIVICAGPRTDFMDLELKQLEEYVLRGGHLLMMVDPTSTVTLKPFLEKFGAEWKNKKTILETNRLQQLAGGNPLAPVINVYDPGHEITRDTRQLSIYPIPTPVEKSPNAPKEYTVTSLFSSSSRSLEVELQGDKVKVNEKTDRKGPISLALAVSGKAKSEGVKKVDPPKTEKEGSASESSEKLVDLEFRMVVVGDADFASNTVRKFGVNSDMFQNMLSWLSKEEDLISIRPKSTEGGEFEVTEFRLRVIQLASVWSAPPLMFIFGIMIWARRRRM